MSISKEMQIIDKFLSAIGKKIKVDHELLTEGFRLQEPLEAVSKGISSLKKATSSSEAKQYLTYAGGFITKARKIEKGKLVDVGDNYPAVDLPKLRMSFLKEDEKVTRTIKGLADICQKEVDTIGIGSHHGINSTYDFSEEQRKLQIVAETTEEDKEGLIVYMDYLWSALNAAHTNISNIINMRLIETSNLSKLLKIELLLRRICRILLELSQKECIMSNIETSLTKNLEGEIGGTIKEDLEKDGLRSTLAKNTPTRIKNNHRYWKVENLTDWYETKEWKKNRNNP